MLAFSDWIETRTSLVSDISLLHSLIRISTTILLSRKKMGSLALHLLTILLGVIFIVLGNIKITPQFFPEYHNQAKNEFGKWNKEFPFYHLTGWRPYAKNYRMAIGVIEMSAGTLLLLAGCKFQSFLHHHLDQKSFFCSDFSINRNCSLTCDNGQCDLYISSIEL